MKGNDQVLAKLNDLLADELTAINQYVVHGEMCARWGYGRLREAVDKRAVDEMRHARKLIARILFLEGRPVVSVLKPMHIGAAVEAQLENDRQAGEAAVRAYNEAARLCADRGDIGTREILESILRDEEDHVDGLEALQAQVRQMGIQAWLAVQLRE